MNFFQGVERVLLSNVAKVYNELKTIDDKTMTGEFRSSVKLNQRSLLGLAFFYGYDILHHAIDLLKHTKRLILYHTTDNPSRRLYQFHANKNQVSVYTLSTSNFCTCTFYKEQILTKQDYFACPHNIAIKLYEQIFQSTNDIDIETFDVSHEYLIEKMFKLIEQSCEIE
jgi:predicted nucleic acid-binding Zn finger protein